MKKLVKTLILAGLLCQAQSAFAAGFYLTEQSISSMGTAFSANTAGLDDAGTVYANPAGMTSLTNPNDAVVGVTYIYPRLKYHDRGTINALGLPMGSNQACGPCAHNTNGGQAGEDAWIPYISYVKQLGCGWAAGVSFNAPFGLSTDYNEKWYGRYWATNSSIRTTNINPAIAYDITNNLTIGAGISGQFVQVCLKKMVDFGLIGAGLGIPGLLPEQNDGKAVVHGTGWGVGGNVGILYKFNCDKTRIGVQYRSQVHYNITNGHIRYKGAPTLLAPAFPNGGAKAKLTLPDQVSIGLQQRWTENLTLYVDGLWTNWKTLQNLHITFKNPNANPTSSTQQFKWKSVWRIAVGGKYQFSEDLAIRAGYFYDWTPVPSSLYRVPGVPDANRQLISFGFQYRVNDCFLVDFGYAHVFFDDVNVNKTGDLLNPNVRPYGGLKGYWSTQADLIGLQVHSAF